MNVNKVILIGRLGDDPVTRFMADGAQIGNMRLATTDRWKDKNTGEAKEATEWHNVVTRGKSAKFAEDYLKKGMLVYVEGNLRTRKFKDKSGNDRQITEVIAMRVESLGPGRAERPEPAPAPRAPAQRPPEEDEDTIPF
jgi:single-strand DNA-binding protein